MKKLVIFDLDGTLINTIADLAGATNYALKACGFVGNGINKLFERALPESERNEENIRKIRSLFVPYYNMHNADLSRPYPGITHVLETLQAEGVSLAVASNKYQEATEKLIKHYFPQIGFIRIFGQRENVPGRSTTRRNRLHRRFGRRHADGHQCQSGNHRRRLGIPPAHRTGSLSPRIHRRYARSIAGLPNEIAHRKTQIYTDKFKLRKFKLRYA